MLIEVAKILQATTFPHFYPSQFVYVTDFLDLFGNLVYDRLLTKAKQERIDAGLAPLPTHFVIHDILEQTRITTRNWFGKIMECKELVPRIYRRLSHSIFKNAAFKNLCSGGLFAPLYALYG
jgi:hypothetical protein